MVNRSVRRQRSPAARRARLPLRTTPVTRPRMIVPSARTREILLPHAGEGGPTKSGRMRGLAARAISPRPSGTIPSSDPASRGHLLPQAGEGGARRRRRERRGRRQQGRQGRELPRRLGADRPGPHRATVLAFYTFARAADDVADSAELAANEKIARLDLFEATLLGQSDAVASALPLRAALARTGLTPRHAQDCWSPSAWTRPSCATQPRRADALLPLLGAPVGRFVLAAHGEAETTWPANDALCSALQIVNHLQDCGKDFRQIDRVYVPQDMLARHGARTDDLGAPAATLALRACLAELARRNAALVAEGASLSPAGARLAAAPRDGYHRSPRRQAERLAGGARPPQRAGASRQGRGAVAGGASAQAQASSRRARRRRKRA